MLCKYLFMQGWPKNTRLDTVTVYENQMTKNSYVNIQIRKKSNSLWSDITQALWSHRSGNTKFLPKFCQNYAGWTLSTLCHTLKLSDWRIEILKFSPRNKLKKYKNKKIKLHKLYTKSSAGLYQLNSNLCGFSQRRSVIQTFQIDKMRLDILPQTENVPQHRPMIRLTRFVFGFGSSKSVSNCVNYD